MTNAILSTRIGGTNVIIKHIPKGGMMVKDLFDLKIINHHDLKEIEIKCCKIIGAITASEILLIQGFSGAEIAGIKERVSDSRIVKEARGL